MKNRCIIFLLTIILSVTVFGALNQNARENTAQTQSYLRIHIRAHSNADGAQAVKYLVRDAVVEYLTPIVADCETKEKAAHQMQASLNDIERVSNGVLQAYGLSYLARASMRREVFPTRVYGEYTLPAGEYTALIIELGEGRGDNWWCVVYPPLCFAAPANKNVIYKSKIIEIIERWKNG